MDKKKAVEHAKKAASIFFRVRRGYKTYLAFATGALSGIMLYSDVYGHFRNKPYSVFLCVLAGVSITAAMLLILKLKRFGIGKGKEAALSLYEKYKERKAENDPSKNQDNAPEEQK